MIVVEVLVDLPDTDGRLAYEVMRRGSLAPGRGSCEVGVTGCVRDGRRYLHVDTGTVVSAETVVYACDACTDRVLAEPAVAARLSGVAA